MRKIIAGLFMSLDGVVDGTDGWQYPYFDQETGAAMAAGTRNTGTLLLGSPTLVRWLLSQRLLDQLNLFLLPIVVGSGLRLFDGTNPRHPLRLVRSRAMRSGVLEVHYAPQDR
jgi:dihydrofolate reductase